MSFAERPPDSNGDYCLRAAVLRPRRASRLHPRAAETLALTAGGTSVSPWRPCGGRRLNGGRSRILVDKDVNPSSVRNHPREQRQERPSCATRCEHRSPDERGHGPTRCAERWQPSCRVSPRPAKRRHLAAEEARTAKRRPSREAPRQNRLGAPDRRSDQRTSPVHSAADAAQPPPGTDHASRPALHHMTHRLGKQQSLAAGAHAAEGGPKARRRPRSNHDTLDRWRFARASICAERPVAEPGQGAGVDRLEGASSPLPARGRVSPPW